MVSCKKVFTVRTKHHIFHRQTPSLCRCNVFVCVDVRYPAGFDDPFSIPTTRDKISLRRPSSTRPHSRSHSSTAFATGSYTNIHSKIGGSSSSSQAHSSTKAIVGTRRSSGIRRPSRSSTSTSRPSGLRSSITTTKRSGAGASKSIKDKARPLKRTSKRGM